MLQRSYNNQTENWELKYLSNGFSLSLHNVRYLEYLIQSHFLLFYGLDKDLVSLSEGTVQHQCITVKGIGVRTYTSPQPKLREVHLGGRRKHTLYRSSDEFLHL